MQENTVHNHCCSCSSGYCRGSPSGVELICALFTLTRRKHSSGAGLFRLLSEPYKGTLPTFLTNGLIWPARVFLIIVYSSIAVALADKSPCIKNTPVQMKGVVVEATLLSFYPIDLQRDRLLMPNIRLPEKDENILQRMNFVMAQAK